MIKRSGLAGIKRATIMPMPTMLTNPKKEVKEIISKLKKVYKPK